MDELEMNNQEGMEPDTVIFEDEDGNEYEFAVRDYFFYNGDEYALLTENGTEAALSENFTRSLLTVKLSDTPCFFCSAA